MTASPATYWAVVELGPANIASSSTRWPIHSGEAHMLLLGRQLRQDEIDIQLEVWGDARSLSVHCRCYPAASNEEEEEEIERTCSAFSQLSLADDHSDAPKASRGEKRKYRQVNETVHSVGPTTLVIVHSFLFSSSDTNSSKKIPRIFPWIEDLDRAVSTTDHGITRCLVLAPVGSEASKLLWSSLREQYQAVFWLTCEDVLLRSNADRMLADLFLACTLVGTDASCIVIEDIDVLFHDNWQLVVQFLLEVDRAGSIRVFALCKDEQALLDEVRDLFAHTVQMRSPVGINEWTRFWTSIEPSLTDVQTRELVSKSSGLSFEEAIQCCSGEDASLLERVTCVHQSIQERVLFVGELPFTFIAAPLNQSVVTDAFAKVGGQQHAKQALTEALIWPRTKAQAMALLNITPIRGILFYGPPGTGKTLLAKCASEASGSNFLSVSVSDLVRGDVGTSEKRVSRLFELARSCSPCVLFFDEAQGLFSNRALLGPSGQKLVSQFLLEMDSLTQEDQVVLLAATNDASQLDDALMRPGRFDRKIFVGPLQAREDRVLVLEMKARELEQYRPNQSFAKIDFTKFADTIPYSLTGAQIAQVLLRAAIEAEERLDSHVNERDMDVSLREETLL